MLTGFELNPRWVPLISAGIATVVIMKISYYLIVLAYIKKSTVWEILSLISAQCTRFV